MGVAASRGDRFEVRRIVLLPIKAVTFVCRFIALLVWTAYLESNRSNTT